MEIQWIMREPWAFVAEDPDLTTYQEDVNRLLLSFKIHTSWEGSSSSIGSAWMTHLSATVILETMNFILAEKSPLAISFEQLNQVNVGFERLQEMDAIDGVSNRTHNAIYFMYGAYFNARHATYLFVLLFTVLEALFSKEGGGAATKTICKRVSGFLGSQPRCTYSDIERLYNIRSELVHGRRKAADSSDNLADTHELEFVVTECMKKVLADRTYLKYKDVDDKEKYFDQLPSAS